MSKTKFSLMDLSIVPKQFTANNFYNKAIKGGFTRLGFNVIESEAVPMDKILFMSGNQTFIIGTTYDYGYIFRNEPDFNRALKIATGKAYNRILQKIDNLINAK